MWLHWHIELYIYAKLSKICEPLVIKRLQIHFAVVHSEETAVAASERIVNAGGFQSVSGVNNCVVSTYFKIKSFEMLRPVESELRIPFRLPRSQLYDRFFRIVNVDHQK